MQGNIFGLANEEEGEETQTYQKSYLTSEFRHVYMVLILK